MKSTKINNVTYTESEPMDSLIYFAQWAYTQTGDKSHLKVIEKLKNSNAKIGLGFSRD